MAFDANQINQALDSALDSASRKMDALVSKASAFGESFSNSIVQNIENVNHKIDALGTAFSNIGGGVQTLAGLWQGSMGQMDSNTQTVLTSIQNFGTNMSALGETASKAVTFNEVISQLTSLKGMLGIAGFAITSLVGVFSVACATAQQQSEEFATALAGPSVALGEMYNGVASSAVDFYNSIATSGSVLSGFNSEIILSGQAQGELAAKINETQVSISETIRNAVDNNLKFNQQEVASLEEKFTKMQELNAQELDMQKSYGDAVQARADALATTHQGSLAEYQEYAAQLIHSAEQVRDETIAKADEQYTEELALRRQMMNTSDEYNEEWYNSQVAALQQQYQTEVDMANQKCGDTIAVLADGYLNQDETLRNHIEETGNLNTQLLEEDQRYKNEKARLEQERNTTTTENSDEARELAKEWAAQQEQIEQEHMSNMKDIQGRISANMDEETQKQAGSWMAMCANAELYGGNISDESKNLKDDFFRNLDKMPGDAKTTFDNTLNPMLTAMQKKRPALFAEAEAIGTGIIYRLRKILEINSPSRKTRKIFQAVMEGAHLGLQDEKNNLLDQAEDIGSSVLDQLNFNTPGGISAAFSQMRRTVGSQAGMIATGLSAGLNGSLASAFHPDRQQDNMIPASGKIKTVLNIDGREFAVATANYMSEELAWRNL